jgi:hypothetical protein
VVFVVAQDSGGTDFVTRELSKVPAEVTLRSWFKWWQAPPVDKWRQEPIEAHRLGILFGGGITCSALYDGENGLSQDQVLEMATRDPYGKLVDAWGQKGIRHGSLSNPAYCSYLFRWCKEQIDAGADSLFMDEINAALSDREGYDAESLLDFRRFLKKATGWPPRSSQWRRDYGIDLDKLAVCPDGSINSFDYSAYLRTQGLAANPDASGNPLAAKWQDFRRQRDDQAWKALVDRIRSYASQQGKTVLINANGLAPYVDLQVLGVWNHWAVSGGHVDLRENQIPVWRSIVEQGQEIAGKPVPVVLFHDWGFGDPPFPLMAVPVEDRLIWMRTRCAEIYAAGGRFAFPMLGPAGCDAEKNGTLPLIAHLASFYRQHREIFTDQKWLGDRSVSANVTGLSIASTWTASQSALAIHVINRNLKNGSLSPMGPVELRLPIDDLPDRAEVITPDAGPIPVATVRKSSGRTVVDISQVEAHAIVLLHYSIEPSLSAFRDPPRSTLELRWQRPTRSEFAVDGWGKISHASEMEGILQGRLHRDLRNPPVFLVDFSRPMVMRVHVKAVATQGARVTISVSGGDSRYALLPDRDGKNDPGANEYDQILECPIPAGSRKVWLDNDGPDWAVTDWIEFVPAK